MLDISKTQFINYSNKIKEYVKKNSGGSDIPTYTLEEFLNNIGATVDIDMNTLSKNIIENDTYQIKLTMKDFSFNQFSVPNFNISIADFMTSPTASAGGYFEYKSYTWNTGKILSETIDGQLYLVYMTLVNITSLLNKPTFRTIKILADSDVNNFYLRSETYDLSSSGNTSTDIPSYETEELFPELTGIEFGVSKETLNSNIISGSYEIDSKSVDSEKLMNFIESIPVFRWTVLGDLAIFMYNNLNSSLNLTNQHNGEYMPSLFTFINIAEIDDKLQLRVVKFLISMSELSQGIEGIKNVKLVSTVYDLSTGSSEIKDTGSSIETIELTEEEFNGTISEERQKEIYDLASENNKLVISLKRNLDMYLSMAWPTNEQVKIIMEKKYENNALGESEDMALGGDVIIFQSVGILITDTSSTEVELKNLDANCEYVLICKKSIFGENSPEASTYEINFYNKQPVSDKRLTTLEEQTTKLQNKIEKLDLNLIELDKQAFISMGFDDTTYQKLFEFQPIEFSSIDGGFAAFSGSGSLSKEELTKVTQKMNLMSWIKVNQSLKNIVTLYLPGDKEEKIILLTSKISNDISMASLPIEDMIYSLEFKQMAGVEISSTKYKNSTDFDATKFTVQLTKKNLNLTTL